MSLPADLEPAVRDPRKLRRTAWILVGIMVLGGTLVYTAYEKWAARQTTDTRPNFLYQIRKQHDLRVLRQDGKTVDLFDPRGGVWMAHAMALSQPETSRLSMEVMKRVAEKHAGNEDLKLVSLVVDAPAPETVATTLAARAEEMEMKLPQWWLCATDPATTHKFIKNQLKAAIFPHQENGQWNYDTSIILIDRGGHIRRAVVPSRKGGAPYIAGFDFDQAAKWDEEGTLTGTERSNVEELERLLNATIDTLLEEPPTER
ncbi:MAG TPA: hypothetical protein VLO11_08285 [Luteolibacter sp.]|nr:hypothetical protein [Luteolibacter sp.]